MPEDQTSRIGTVLRKQQSDILDGWMREQARGGALREDLISLNETREQCREFLQRVTEAVEQAESTNVHSKSFGPVLELLASISKTRTRRGFTSAQIAKFIFSFKQPLFTALRAELADQREGIADAIWTATELIDQLALYTTEVQQKNREEVIIRQQQEMLELSTPVVKLWDGVLALPLIGTLDSARTQVVMESLLQRITETGSEIAIIDITGVPTVDTLVAQHLMKTVAAARLMGADCIISGIRPQIAQTIVHLGLELTGIATKATLAGAFILALQRTGYTVSKDSARRTMPSEQGGKAFGPASAGKNTF